MTAALGSHVLAGTRGQGHASQQEAVADATPNRTNPCASGGGGGVLRRELERGPDPGGPCSWHEPDQHVWRAHHGGPGRDPPTAWRPPPPPHRGPPPGPAARDEPAP